MMTETHMFFPYFVESAPQLEKVGKITCSLELGSRWTKEKIVEELIVMQENYSTANQKLEFLAKSLCGTPCFFESFLPILPDSILRVRFSSFDCITFVYTILALCGAKNFVHFVEKLYRLRYKHDSHGTIKNNPLDGNIFDFVHESVLVNASALGYLKNITPHIQDKNSLLTITVDVKKFKRNSKFDNIGYVVAPKFYEGEITEHFINVTLLDKLDLSYLQSGDLAIFTVGEKTRKGDDNLPFINHLAVIMKEKEGIHFIHSTLSFALNTPPKKFDPYADALQRGGDISKLLGTGIYYDNDPQKEQIGVGYGGEYAGDECRVTANGMNYYGYDQTKKRPFSSYAQENFVGVIFLRPLG